MTMMMMNWWLWSDEYYVKWWWQNSDLSDKGAITTAYSHYQNDLLDDLKWYWWGDARGWGKPSHWGYSTTVL